MKLLSGFILKSFYGHSNELGKIRTSINRFEDGDTAIVLQAQYI